MSEPRPFDMSCTHDIKQWFKEMHSYLRTEDFLNQGTDRKGREYAWEGFLALETMFNTPQKVLELGEEEGTSMECVFCGAELQDGDHPNSCVRCE